MPLSTLFTTSSSSSGCSPCSIYMHSDSHTHTQTYTLSVHPSAKGAAAVSSSPRLQTDNRRTTSSQPWPTHVLPSRHWLTANSAHLPLNTPPMTQCSSPPYTPPFQSPFCHTYTHICSDSYRCTLLLAILYLHGQENKTGGGKINCASLYCRYNTKTERQR